MNLYELDELTESVKDDKELFDFYIKKREFLIAQIKKNLAVNLAKI